MVTNRSTLLELSEQTVWEQVRDITYIDQASMFGRKLGLKNEVVNEILSREKPNVAAHVMFVRSKENVQDNTEMLTRLDEAVTQLQGDTSTSSDVLDLYSPHGTDEPQSLSNCTGMVVAILYFHIFINEVPPLHAHMHF